MAKRILTGEASQQAILRGIDSLAEAVRVTLGPLGRNVVLGRRFGLPTITKDGVTVAKEIELQDRLENVGAQALREVAAKTAAEAGDGTTTATVLAQAVYRHGLRNVAAGENPMEVKHGLERAAEAVASRLASLSRPVGGDAVAHVATLSANGDEVLGRIVGQTIENVGQDGVISVEEGQWLETSVEVVEGMQFESGYSRPTWSRTPSACASVSRTPRSSSTRRSSARPGTCCRSSSRCRAPGCRCSSSSARRRPSRRRTTTAGSRRSGSRSWRAAWR
jgi:chaperonin GroEL